MSDIRSSEPKRRQKNEDQIHDTTINVNKAFHQNFQDTFILLLCLKEIFLIKKKSESDDFPVNP